MEIKVYRWEHKDYGCGPYNCYKLHISDKDVKRYGLFNDHQLFEHCDIWHPHPMYFIDDIPDDSVRKKYKDAFYSDAIFGFSSLNDANVWFTCDEIDIMKHFGFVFKEYTIDINNYFPMNRQCMFIPKDNGKIVA